jgi:hypothetical protein
MHFIFGIALLMALGITFVCLDTNEWLSAVWAGLATALLVILFLAT